MGEDAKAFAKKCDKCEQFAHQLHQPVESLHSILSPLVFLWNKDGHNRTTASSSGQGKSFYSINQLLLIGLKQEHSQKFEKNK